MEWNWNWLWFSLGVDWTNNGIIPINLNLKNELDKIFVPFVERHFKNLSEQEISELFRLFEIDDVILADIIIYRKTEYPEELKGIFIKLFEFYSEI